MQITIVVPHLSGGGAELVACKWAEGLAGLGHTLTVVLTHGTSTGRTIQGVKVVSLPGNNTPGRLFALRSLLKEAGSDFVIGVMPYCNLLAVIAAFGLACRTVVSEHAIHSSAAHSLPLSGQLQWQIAKRLYRQARGCIAVSHALAAELSAACSIRQERLWVVQNPVLDALKVVPSSAPVPDVSSPRISIVSPSRLVPIKRLATIIEAAQLLKESGRLVELHFFGDGPDRGMLEGLAAAAGLNAKFYGRVEKWWIRAPASSIVVLASRLEGFGNVLVEAAANHLPSVASSKALGVADACIPGITAQLVSGETAADFADGILRAHAMAPLIETSVVANWLTRFTVQEVALVMERILKSAASTGSIPSVSYKRFTPPSTSRN